MESAGSRPTPIAKRATATVRRIARGRKCTLDFKQHTQHVGHTGSTQSNTQLPHGPFERGSTREETNNTAGDKQRQRYEPQGPCESGQPRGAKEKRQDRDDGARGEEQK